jgi:hypothetical protein
MRSLRSYWSLAPEEQEPFRKIADGTTEAEYRQVLASLFSTLMGTRSRKGKRNDCLC